MKITVAGLPKTDHFMFRQWDRNITDNVLAPILKNIKLSEQNTIVVVSRNVLRALGFKFKKELFIKINEGVLITCFFSEFQEYSNSKRKQEYYIINQI